MNNGEDLFSADNSEKEQELTSLMERALVRDAEALSSFYKQFLTSKFFVPSKTQKIRIKNSFQTDAYPLFSLLSLTIEEKVYTPIFTSKERFLLWCQERELEYYELQGDRIIDSIPPENFWIIMNPNAEIEKELSPWEIEKLCEGEESISEIVEDYLSDEQIRDVQIRLVEEEEYSHLKDALRQFCSETIAIETLYFFLEESRAEEKNFLQLYNESREETLSRNEEQATTLFVGVELSEKKDGWLVSVQQPLLHCYRSGENAHLPRVNSAFRPLCCHVYEAAERLRRLYSPSNTRLQVTAAEQKKHIQEGLSRLLNLHLIGDRSYALHFFVKNNVSIGDDPLLLLFRQTKPIYVRDSRYLTDSRKTEDFPGSFLQKTFTALKTFFGKFFSKS
jgi:hypothetical protein